MSPFVRDMERLTEATFQLAALVEEMIRGAVRALRGAKPELAEQVLSAEAEVDRLEVDIEEQCLRLLALHSPVASDLRRVMAFLKVSSELERMADLAAGIATRAIALSSESASVPVPECIEEMGVLASEMVRGSLDALTSRDANRARAVIALDDKVDRLFRDAVEEIKSMMKSRIERVDAGPTLISAATKLERIADHATNVAEEVIYLTEGVIVRHREAAPVQSD